VNDELDSIGADQLSEVFAVEVAETLKPTVPKNGAERAYEDTQTGAYRSCEWRECFTDYATDEHAVLPYAQKLKRFHVYWDDHKMIVAEATPSYHIDFAGRCWVRNAPTLARAFCIALIRHARVSRGHNKSRS